MHDGLLRPAGAEDVRAAYILLLARPAESVAAVEQRIDTLLAEVIAELLGSEEFRHLAIQTAGSGILKQDGLSRRDHAATARWLRRIAPGLLDPAANDWWSLLRALFGAIDPASLPGGEDVAAFHRMVTDRVEANARRFETLQPFLTFDEPWYLRAHLKARLALAGGAVDSAVDHFLDTGMAARDQLLPFFSDGFERSYRKVGAEKDHSFGDVLDQLFLDAQSGHLSHWLFSRAHYRAGIAWAGDGRANPGQRSDAELYVDFLTFGDAAGLAPHPLFSHHAYAALNPSATLHHGATFRDYVTEGCFAGRRTSAVFDDDYYLVFNPDARHALLTGSHASALHHFLTVGIHRDATFSPDFDAGFYLSHYPDVGDAINAGTFPSAAWHFVHLGLGEGRLPHPYFNPVYYRQRHPQAADEMRRLHIRSELEHFLLIGRARGYKPEQPLVATRPAMDAAKAIFQRRARRSFDGLTREPRDFSPFAADPAISLIVPVCDEVEFTARFLDCAWFAAAHLKHATGIDCEVIVVDNGSTDDTAALLVACPGLVVDMHDAPIGFPRAVNAGVGRARGEIVVVANNDIEFAPDVLVRVRERLAADATIGVLGGLTILPNETVQEAGSFLDAGAGVIGLGRHEDPWDPYFRGVHEADFCTGSFNAFRRADHAAVGGYDEGFSPGYYEETDFAFRLADALGKRAVVDSAIQITHFEHASFGKGRPPTSAYAQIRRNQQRFVDKHRAALRRRPAPMALNGGAGARPPAIGRTRLLVIEDAIPDARLGPVAARSARLLAALTRFGIAHDLLVLEPREAVDDYGDPRVTVHRGWMPGEDADTLLAHQSGRYSHVMVGGTHNLLRFAGRLEELRHRHGFTLICDTGALSTLRALEMQRQAGRTVDDAARLDAVRLELGAPTLVDHWIATGPGERDRIAAAGFASVSVIGRPVAPPAADALPPFEARRRVLVAATVAEAGAPDHDGLLWFLDHVRPHCREALAALTLTVIGDWRPDLRERFVARYAGIAIDFAEATPDRTRLYAETRLVLAPVRFAADGASAVLEPMMHGVPVVLTGPLADALTGDAAADAQGLTVARLDDGGEDFAACATRLATDPEAWRRVQAAQYAVATPLAGQAAFDDGVRALIDATNMRPAGSDRAHADRALPPARMDSGGHRA